MKRSHTLYIGISLAAFVLVSCSNHLSPVKEYLEEYTSGAGIGTHAIVTEWRKDSAQTANLPSASTARIRFLMRNPRSYTIDYGIVFDDAVVNADASSPTDYEFVTASDRQSFELVLYPGFLRRNEGRIISATVSLSENLTGRPFEPYHFALVSNTAPPVPQGPLVMISDGGSNVVCFNLDLSDAIHGDIDAVLINGAEYPVVSVSAGSPQSFSFDVSSAATTVAPSGMQAHAGTTAFVAASGMTAVYVVTGDSSATPKNYLVSVRDERGLLGSATISSNPNQLGQVLVTDANGQLVANLPNATLVIPSNGTTASVVLTGPSLSTVHWSYTKDGTTLETDMSGASPHMLSLLPGNYSLTAYARMAGYADSDPITVNFKVLPTIYEVFVHPYNGNDASGMGTYGDPVQTIGRAVQMLTNPNDPNNTINLLEDVPGLAPASHPDDMVHLEFNQDTQFTLEGNNNSINGGNLRRCLYISSASNVVKVRVNSLKINNGSAKTTWPYGGGICFNAPTGDSSLTLDTCDVWNNTVTNTTTSEGGGGGVYSRCRTVRLINGSSIRENTISSTAIARGAGLFAQGSGTVDISDSSFSYNRTTVSTTTEGAGLYCAGASITAPITCNISNSQLTNNSGVASGTGRGGGIYAENATVTLSAGSNLQDNTANEANSGRGGGLYAYNAGVAIVSCFIQRNKATYAPSSFSVEALGGGICFEKNQGNPSLTLTDTNVTGNNCNITGSTITGKTAGAGIYVIGTGSTPTIVSLSGGRINNNITNPAATTFSSSEGGLGGGICLLDRVQATIDGVWVNVNSANNCTSGTGKGGGIYFDSESFSDASLTILNAASISGNYASNGLGGQGGGIFLKSGSGGKIDFKFQGGTIQGNYASASGGTGQGGGIYAISANNTSRLSVSISEGSIMGNTANSSNGTGYGGGIYSSVNTALTVSGGDISGNLGSATGTSEGDGIQLVGNPGNTTQFSLSAPAIGANNASSVSNQAINITNQYVVTTFTKDAKVDSSALVVLNGATISTSGYLTQDPIANIRLAFAGQSDVIVGDTRLNYYKFLMENTSWCVNASGKKSTIRINTASLYGDILNALTQLPFADPNDTMVISITIPNDTVNSSYTLSIPTNAHVRIVPNVAMNLTVNQLANLIQVQQGAHLLFGSPSKTTTLQYLSASTPSRTGNTIDTGANSSLVLRNVTIQDAAADPFTPSEAALVSSGVSGTAVIEMFKYWETPLIPVNSKYSAIMLNADSVCHFVSGEILNFTSQSTGYGGFAHVEAGAALTVHSGTFTGNRTVSGSSVTGGGLLFNPAGLDLR